MATTAASCLPAAIKAIAAALKADATLLTLLGDQAKVYSRAPDNVTRPYLWILSGAEDPQNAMKTFGRVGQVEVVAVSGYEGTEEADALVSRAMEVLDNQRLTLDGYGSGHVDWLLTRASELAPSIFDGLMEFQRRAIFVVTAR